MKVFVTGVKGQLGYDVMDQVLQRGYSCVGSDLASDIDNAPENARLTYVPLDISDAEKVHETIEREHPDVIVHCAAWTAVDAAEKAENMDKVYAVNVEGTRYVAEAAKTVDAKLVFISTDYVFDGEGTSPWDPDEEDYAPLNRYGASKREGERIVEQTLEKYFLVRAAWLFGKNGNNFVRTMLRIAQGREFVTVVDDQIGTPTYTKDLARLLVDMIETDKYGRYHATNSEEYPGAFISWADFTEETYRIAHVTTAVRRVTTEEYGLNLAKRPFNSRLDKSKLERAGFKPLPDWKDALRRYLKEIGY